MRLSNVALHAGGSMIRKMYNEALNINDKISFTVGEPDFTTPRPIIDAACEAWKRGLTHYTPNRGIPELCDAVAAFHADKLQADPGRNVIITCGATEAIQLALFSLVDPGEEIIIITPAWPNYFGMAAMCGAKLKIVPARQEDGFVPDPDDIQKAITSNTKAIIINYPCNPTGAVLDESRARRLAEILRDRDISVISDEVYSQFVFDGKTHVSVLDYEGLRDKTVYVGGFSKMFAMTGWRLGYAIAREDVIASMVKLHENGASNLPAPTQLAGVEALRSCRGEIYKMRDAFEKRRGILCEAINAIPGLSCSLPGGAFYAFVDIQKISRDSEAFCMDLLHKTGVVSVPGIGFGDMGEGFVRFTLANSEDNIREGMKRLRSYVESLKQNYSKLL
jgi:aminotransferase